MKVYKSTFLNNYPFIYIFKNQQFDSLIKKIEKKKYIISFINPHSFYISTKNKIFKKSLIASKNFVDGIGIFLIIKFFLNINILRITGFSFTNFLISKLSNKKFFFLGSTKKILKKIKKNLLNEYPSIKIQFYSPPFTDSFSQIEKDKILNKINKFEPDIIFVGMTAPKQEIWSYENYHLLKNCSLINVGAVFDYLSMSDNKQKVLLFFSKIGLEWLHRLFLNPIRMCNRVFVTFPQFLFYMLKKYVNKFYYIKIKIVINYKNFLNKKHYCLAAFNLAAFSFLHNNLLRKIYFWPDGIFFKLFKPKLSKLPGSKLIHRIKYINNLEKIIVVGNLNKNSKLFLSKHMKCKIIHFKLPYGNIEDIVKYCDNKFKFSLKNSIYLLTLPTPKQEILAQAIYKRNKCRIICIGGGLAIASGYEKICPKILYNLGLEFIWRLQFETKRRTVRLFMSIVKFIYKTLNLQIFKIKAIYING